MADTPPSTPEAEERENREGDTAVTGERARMRHLLSKEDLLSWECQCSVAVAQSASQQGSQTNATCRSPFPIKKFKVSQVYK